MSTTPKLYTNPFSRGAIVQWYLEEIGVAYEKVHVDFKNKPAELFEVNPAGKIPALQDGDICVAETNAVLWYLADKHGKLPSGLKERAALMQWVSYAGNEVGGIMANPAQMAAKFTQVLGVLEKALSQRAYLAGEEFSIADVMASSALDYVPMMYKEADFTPYPKVQAYLQRLHERPACAKNLAVFFQKQPAGEAATPAKRKAEGEEEAV